MKAKIIAVFGLALTLAGCATATSGYQFKAENVAQLEPGITTATEAQALLGQPYQVQTQQNGEQLYIWQFVSSTARTGWVTTNVETNVQQAAIVFDPSGYMLRVQNLINVAPPRSMSR